MSWLKIVVANIVALSTQPPLLEKLLGGKLKCLSSIILNRCKWTGSQPERAKYWSGPVAANCLFLFFIFFCRSLNSLLVWWELHLLESYCWHFLNLFKKVNVLHLYFFLTFNSKFPFTVCSIYFLLLQIRDHRQLRCNLGVAQSVVCNGYRL